MVVDVCGTGQMAGHRYAGGKGTGRTHAPEHAKTEKRRRMTTCWDPVRSLVNTRKTVPNTRLGCVNTRVRFEDGPGGRALRAVGVRPSERATRAPRGPAPSGLKVGLEPAEDGHGRF